MISQASRLLPLSGSNIDSDYRFMRRAYALAQQAQAEDEVPVGAVLVKNKQIIAEAYNQSRALNDPSAHAEIQVLRQAGQILNNYRLLDTTLYVTLEPCSMCAGALVQARVRRVVYACGDPKAGAAGSVFNILQSMNLNHRCIVSSGVLEQQCSSLLSSFFAEKRKR